MSTATQPSESLEARIKRQRRSCPFCEAEDKDLIRCFDPGDLDAGGFKACAECTDEYGLESYEQSN